MIALIDRFLERFTMYRLTLYYLIAILALGAVLSVFGRVPGGPLAVIGTTAVILGTALLVNLAFSRVMRVNANPESTLITALILSLIMGPVSVLSDPRKTAILAAASAAAVASKYLLALRRQHIFNPAAVGAAVSGLAFGSFATWWVGTSFLLPLVAIGGLLLLRKVNRLRMVGVFLGAFVVFLVFLGMIQGADLSMAVQSIIFVLGQSSVLFFAAVMLTEPATSPKRLRTQALYAVFAAFLYQPQLTILGQNLTPEEALLLANLFSWAVSPHMRLDLTLREKKRLGSDVIAFSFDKPARFVHRPGQYMEWSLPVPRSGSKGSRRHFSIASAPTEDRIMIAARFPAGPSRYKKVMERMPEGGRIRASELGGDFVLPRDQKLPLLFVAGGIGITPFRSMLKYMVDTGQTRDVVLLYSAATEEDIVFRDVLDEAQCRAGLKAVYTLTRPVGGSHAWRGAVGPIDRDLVAAEVERVSERACFVSGSPGLVDSVTRTLRAMGVPRRRIHMDFFPGYGTP